MLTFWLGHSYNVWILHWWLMCFFALHLPYLDWQEIHTPCLPVSSPALSSQPQLPVFLHLKWRKALTASWHCKYFIFVCLVEGEETKWPHMGDDSSVLAPDHTNLCIWPSLTSRNETRASVCQAEGLIWQSYRIITATCTHLQGPGWSSRLIWDEYR